MPGSSTFILLLVFDHLSVWKALSKNEWFYQYSQQNIFGFIIVRSTATNLESLVSWPGDTTSLADQYNLMKSIYYLEQLYTLEKKKKENWVTDSSSLVVPDEIMQH